MRRKTIAATAVVLSLVLLIVGVAASETNRPLLSGQQGEFTFAPLAVGDHATYSVEVVDDKGRTLVEKHPLWELQWTNLTTEHDIEGVERTVALAYVGSHNVDDDGNFTAVSSTKAIEVGTWDMVYYSYLSEPRTDLHGDKIYESFSDQRFYVDDELFVIPCPMRNQLAGQTIDLRDSIDPMQHCSWWDHWAESTPLKAIRTDEFEGRDAVTFRNQHGSMRQVTFAEGFSFPVQLLVERQNDLGTFHVIRLETFRAGDTPIPMTPQDISIGSFSPLSHQSWDRYPFGIIDQPYPLDEAIADARDHPERSETRDWMEAHPDWYVSSSDSQQDEMDRLDGTHEVWDTWSIDLTDGSSLHSFVLDRVTSSPQAFSDNVDTGPVDGVLDDAPADDPTTEVTETVSFRTQSTLPRTMPSADALPAMPPASQLIPRWHLLSGMEEATAMSSHIQCINTCDDIYYTVGVGVAWSDNPGNGESEHIRTEYLFTHDSRTGDGAQFHTYYGRWSFADAQDTILSQPDTPSLDDAWTSPAEQAAFALGSIGLLSGVIGLLWPTLRGAGLLSMFSRIRNDKVLEHPQRRRIIEAVDAAPGIHMRQLRDRLGLGSGVTDHHVRKMEQAGLVQVDRRGSYVCLFPKGHMDHSAMAVVPLMKADGAKAIISALCKGPSSQVRLAETTGLSKGTLSYHLKRLSNVGAVDVQKDGRTRRIMLTPLGEQAARATPAA